MSFKIASAFVEVKADSAGLRGEVDRAVTAAGAGQDIKVGVSLRQGGIGGLFANLAPFILPTMAAVGQLTGVLGLVPAAASAAGIAYGTIKVGIAGFGDALKQANAAKSTKELNDALKDLSPSARDAALTVHNLGPAWNNLHLDVQQRLFQGVGKDIQRLGIVDLPVLRSGLDQTASALNQGVHYFTSWATSSKTVGDLKTIFDNTGVSTQNLMRSLQPILSIVRDLATVGSQFLPQLSSGFATAAQHVADFIGHARQTGQLAQWIQTGITAFGQLWQVIKNVVGIIMQMAETGPSILPMLATVTGWILKLVQAVPELIPIIMGMIAAWRAYVIVQAAVNAVMLANPITLVIVALAALVAAIVIAWNHSETFRTIVLGAWGAIRAATEAAFNAVRSVITSVMSTIGSVISGAVNTAKSVFNWFGSLPGLISGWFNGAVSAARSALGSLVSAVGAVPGQIMGAIGNLGSLLYNAGRNVIQGLINGIKSMIGAVGSAISSVASTIRGALPFSPAKWGPLSGSGSPDIAGSIIGRMIADGMNSSVAYVAAASVNLANAANLTDPASPVMRRSPAPAAGSDLPDIVKFGSVSQAVWSSLLNAGWAGRADDHMEALYRPAGQQVTVNVIQQSGSPAETARLTALALRTVA